MICWPKPWLEAAQAAGFALHDPATGTWHFLGGSVERAKLQQFAEIIAENERNCAADDLKDYLDRENL